MYSRLISLVSLIFPLIALAPPNTASADAKLYWVDTSLLTVNRSDLDGSNVETIATTPNPVNGVTVDPLNDVVYWIECCGALNSRIRRADAAGGNEVTIPTAIAFGFPARILLDPVNQYLFTSDLSLLGIKRVNSDGSGLLILSGGPTTGLALDPIADKIYWTETSGPDTGIHRMNLDGTSAEPVFTFAGGDPIFSPRGIAIDAGDSRMYWTDGTRVARANLDGTGYEVVADGLSEGVQAAEGIAVDPIAQKLYWGDTTRNTIRKADLDGSNAVDIITGLAFPRGLDVVPLPEPGVAAGLIAGWGLLVLLHRIRRR